jgi:pectate lyase
MHAAVEGFGAASRGGAGQPECVVRSLADSGSGTLRECLSGGNRHVTFAVAGTITLAKQLGVLGSFVTIDGFSAPSPGITLRGWGLDIRNVHDVIVRGLRIRDTAGGYTGESSYDCLLVYGSGAYNIVVDHVSVHNCADGGIDISTGPQNVTVQWSIISTAKLALWGSTSSSVTAITDRISVHHSMLICGPEAIWAGCDRAPLIRASGYPVTVDLRNNVFEGWLRANGTKIEAAAEVNVVGNAYIPRRDSSFSQRQASIAVNPGTRVYTAGNIELGVAPRPNLNDNGNETRPFPAAPVTDQPLGCVLRDAGMHPRDATDKSLLPYVSQVPASCDETPIPPPSFPPPAVERPDLVARALSAPSAGTAGQSLSLSTTIANVGTAAAPGSTARLYLSTDRTLGAGDVALGSIAVPGLPPDAAHTGTTSVTLPAATAAGAYMLLAHADDGNGTTESSETNNTLAIPITVAIASSRPFVPLLLEAESMAVTSGMSIGSDPGAMGGQYLSPTSGTNSTAPVREASVAVTIPTAGIYYLWARMYGPSTAADALYLGIGASWDRAYPSATGRYQWLRIETANGSGAYGFQLAPGTHAIQVGRGEVNTRLDAVYVTSNASDVPAFSPDPIVASIPVLLEAESMAVTSGMSVGSDPGALGGGYLSPTSGTNSTAPVREASVAVTIPTAGTYYLWARMYGASGAADALYLGFEASWDRVFPTVHGSYQWVRIETANGSGAYGFQLAPGTHTIQVGRGEVNTRLDAVYVTGSATDVPVFTPQTATSQMLRR